MKTKELAVYLFTVLVGGSAMFGFVPPLLNARDSVQNALGCFLAVGIVFGAVLTFHATYTNSNKTKE